MIGYIYAIKSRNYVKIGKSVDLTKRYRELQHANPERLTLYDAWMVHRNHLDEAERAAHLACKTLHVRNEWFRFMPEIFSDAISAALGSRILAPFRLSLIDAPEELKRHILVTAVKMRVSETVAKALHANDK